MTKQNNKTHKRIQLGKFKLDTLLNVTQAINDNLSKNKLFEIYQNILVNELIIGKLLLFRYDNSEWKTELCINTNTNISVNNDLLEVRDITVINQEQHEKINEFDVIVPVFHKSKPLAYLLLSDFDGEKIEVSPIIKHLSFIQTLTNIIIVAVENKRLFKENLKQAAIKKEMELASEMQSMLFPNILPDNDEISVSAKYFPHQLVGGDYYDFIKLNRDEVAFCIADVSGKGVPAALLMSNFQASLRALISRTSSLTELVTELNKNILVNAKREKFITAFIAKYNLNTRNLQFINAGHNPPQLLIGHQIIELIEGSTILGMFENLPSVTEKNVTIPTNSTLICYTDGVTEQTNKNDVEFGTSNLNKAMLLKAEDSINECINYVISEINSFKANDDYDDDLAILGIRFK